MHKLALIVDDDHDLIEYLKEILESLELEIEVIVADNGLDGIKKIEENIDNLDIVFLDMRMSDVNGIVVYNKSRKFSCVLPIVFMSGGPLAELSEDLNVYFLPKPFTFEDIELIIEKLGF